MLCVCGWLSFGVCFELLCKPPWVTFLLWITAEISNVPQGQAPWKVGLWCAFGCLDWREQEGKLDWVSLAC